MGHRQNVAIQNITQYKMLLDLKCCLPFSYCRWVKIKITPTLSQCRFLLTQLQIVTVRRIQESTILSIWSFVEIFIANSFKGWFDLLLKYSLLFKLLSGKSNKLQHQMTC